MLDVESLHHVSLVVTDLERARRFYRDDLGLTEIPRPPFDFPGAWFGIGEAQLHLIVHPCHKTLRGTRAIDSRDGHFALRVKSYRRTREWLSQKGYEMKMNPQSPTGWPQLFITDPDGNVIEFNAAELDDAIDEAGARAARSGNE
jgi:glyoxylase I family protein